MEDMVCADARKVGDGHARVEGARVDETSRQQPVTVHNPEQSDSKVDEAGDVEQIPNEVVGLVGVALRAVFGHVPFDGFMNGENIVFHMEVHLIHGTVHFARLEHDHGDGEFVALVDALVGDEAVEHGNSAAVRT
jgi:hypothetical protein